jgi:hypothetical protein
MRNARRAFRVCAITEKRELQRLRPLGFSEFYVMAEGMTHKDSRAYTGTV